MAVLWPAQPVEAQRIETIARVIATSDVGGRFAHPVCDGSRHLVATDHAAFTYALVRHADDEDEPLILDMGGLLTPHGVARYAANHRPSSLAVMVQQLGYRALTFGLSELGAPRAGIIAVTRELRERGIPMIATNLRCTDEESEALCAQLHDVSDGPLITRVRGRPTAIVSVLRRDAATLVAPDRTEGLYFHDPKEVIETYTRASREAGVEMVIAVVDNGVEGGALEMAATLAEDARPDLLLVAGESNILFARPSTVRPVLVGVPMEDAVEVRVRESEEMRQGYEFLAQPLGGRGVTAGRPVLDWIDRIGRDYCEAWGRPLAGGSLGEAISIDQFMNMVARIMREITGADIAILNRDALDNAWTPAHDEALTASDVQIALQFDEPLTVAEVDERWLKELALTVERSHGGLVSPGLTWRMSGETVSAVKIGGHASEARARYRVVTIRFLAAGGDQALPDLIGDASWEPLDDRTLRGAVLEWLEEPREQDPRQALPDPDAQVEWLFRADANLTFSGSTIHNPRTRCTEDTPEAQCVDGLVVDEGGATSAAYSTTQLSQSDTLTFGLSLDLAANAAAPDWTWQNSGNILYRTTWTEPTASGGGEFIEASDQIRIRSTLSSRGLRNLVEDGWYIPDPTVDVFLESEFTQPDTRDYHWFLTRPTAGLRFQLLDKLQLQLVGGLQVQPFDPEGQVEPGLGATLTLTQWDFLKLDQRFARLAFTFDYFVADLGDTNFGALRGTLEGALDLAGPLALSFRVDLLLNHREGQDIGLALTAVAGIQLGYLGREIGP